SERFDALQTACVLGSEQPNLLVWMGQAAVDAGRSDDVFRIGRELRTRANRTREIVQASIAWEDTGRAAWKRIQATLEASPDRDQLVGVLRQYANDTHWAHTFLGLEAAERGHLLEAGQHLLSSSKVWGEPRLSSYGPSFVLARKLCEAGLWR